MDKTKPIFVIKFPKLLSNEDINKFRHSVMVNNPSLTKQYHIFYTMNPNSSDEMTFEMYNSPYDEKEFNNLKEFMRKLNEG